MENNIANKDFFKEEELCGHLVTAQTKKLWAVQIGCLEELKRICKIELLYGIAFTNWMP